MNALVAQAEGLRDLAQRSACELEPTYSAVELGARDLGVTLRVSGEVPAGASRPPRRARPPPPLSRRPPGRAPARVRSTRRPGRRAPRAFKAVRKVLTGTERAPQVEHAFESLGDDRERACVRSERLQRWGRPRPKAA